VAAGSARLRARLLALAEELQRGRIIEAPLREPGYLVHGVCDPVTEVIIIDPAPAIVSTLLHELLHRRYPAWSERRVRQEEKRLMGIVSDEDVRYFYQQYNRRRRRKRATVFVNSSEGGK
jgi:hypothetical protein